MSRAAAILLAVTMAPIPAAAQVGCLPPEEPFAYAPPEDDPELRALIDEQYQDYIDGTEAYLNCLNDEAARARVEFQVILDRYLTYFGDGAGVEFEAID
ncbi:hypothetical protein [uncultured Jannaschia sp.]|uniref:hypothetical protein n=1 Tax=uncultured Jannaschia sp. TaxID=293347 RepID=UPI00261FE252|nr:hypothetical protein [uncultured Jannaschia sp.]